MNRAVCTIVSNNYLAYARVLGRSLQTHHPESQFYVLVVDEEDNSAEFETLPFTTVRLDDVFENPDPLLFRYSILEVNTAVKPSLIRHLFVRSGAEQVAYFDPDILILDTLGEVWAALESASLVLTPHVLSPLPDDHARPNECSFLQSGTYNLGFAAFSDSPEMRSFLDWWDQRLRTNCVHSVQDGLFVDQRWMDLALAYLDHVHVCRDPRMNVAYWNLHNRHVEKSDGSWTVEGQPVGFFHFSGYDLSVPNKISKHQDRVRFEDVPGVKELFDEYGRLLVSEGHQAYRQIPYGYSNFEDGRPVPSFARSAYRRLGDAQDRWPHPFQCGPGSFVDWLGQPSEPDECSRLDQHGQVRPRFVHEFWRSRADLQQAFPAIPGESEDAYSNWLLDDEIYEEPLPDSWREALAAYRRAIEAARHKQLELNLEESSDPVDVRRRIVDGAMSFLLELHSSRPDLSRAFPDPTGADRERFLYWWISEGSLAVPGAAVSLSHLATELPLRSRWSAGIRRRLVQRRHRHRGA